MLKLKWVIFTPLASPNETAKIKHNTLPVCYWLDKQIVLPLSHIIGCASVAVVRLVFWVAKSTVFPKNWATFQLLLWDTVFSLPVKGLTDYLTVLDLHSFVMEGHW